MPRLTAGCIFLIGRFKNNLSFQVTGFISEEVYTKILADYEQELMRRMESGR